jgi:hypothetical protein
MRDSTFIVVLACLMAGACTMPDRPDTVTAAPATAPAMQTPAPDIAAEPSNDDEVLPREGLAMSEFAITMRRGACFGRCPQYSVTVDGGGNVDFTGTRFVNASGSHHGKADMSAVAALRSKTNAVFADVGDIVPGTSACKHYATDHPQITLELRTADGVRTLRHYTGCASSPPALRELEALIDRTANVDEWVSGRALR